MRPGNYGNLQTVGDKIFYTSFSRSGGQQGAGYFDLKEKKEVDLGSGISLTPVPSGKKMLVRQGNRYGIIPVPSAKVELKETINTGDMKVLVDLSEEWENIFNESWRQMRDFFL